MDSKLKLNQNGVKRFGLDEYFQQPEANQTPIQQEQVLGQFEDPNFDNVPDEYKQQYLDSLGQQDISAGLQPIDPTGANIPEATPMDTPIDNSLDIPDYTGSNDTTGLGSVFGGRKGRIQQLEKEQQQQESGYYDALENAYKKEPQVSGGKIASALMLTLLPTILARTSGNKALLNASAETVPMTVKSINDLTAQDTARQQKLGLVQAERLGKEAQTTGQQLDRAVSAEERFNDQKLLAGVRDKYADGNRQPKEGGKGLTPEEEATYLEIGAKIDNNTASATEKMKFNLLDTKAGATYARNTTNTDVNAQDKADMNDKRFNAQYGNQKINKLTPEQTNSLSVAGNVQADIVNALPEFERASKEGMGWTELQWKSIFPQEKIGRLTNQLNATAADMRSAKEKGVMTDFDFERYQNIIALSPKDTPQSIVQKLKDGYDYIEASKKRSLQALANSNVDIVPFAKQYGYKLIYPKVFGTFYKPEELGGGSIYQDTDGTSTTPTATGGIDKNSAEYKALVAKKEEEEYQRLKGAK